MAYEDEDLRVEGLVQHTQIDGKVRYNIAQKKVLIERCCEAGVSLARVAKANNINLGMLRKWVRQFKQSAATSIDAPRAPAQKLLPVRMIKVAKLNPSANAPLKVNSVEVHLARGTLKIESIDPAMLAALIDVLAQPQ